MCMHMYIYIYIYTYVHTLIYSCLGEARDLGPVGRRQPLALGHDVLIVSMITNIYIYIYICIYI